MHLFKTQWTNPDPDQSITSIDYVAAFPIDRSLETDNVRIGFFEEGAEVLGEFPAGDARALNECVFQVDGKDPEFFREAGGPAVEG